MPALVSLAVEPSAKIANRCVLLFDRHALRGDDLVAFRRLQLTAPQCGFDCLSGLFVCSVISNLTGWPVFF
jgi:hypothetical protein